MAALGIGGFFFRARDPTALADWYRTHLGVGGADFAPWRQEAGPTVFQPFAEDDSYFAADRRWMLNFRVADLEAETARLAAADIAVTRKAEWDMPGVGRFARLHDPEGNPIELWEASAGTPAS